MPNATLDRKKLNLTAAHIAEVYVCIESRLTLKALEQFEQYVSRQEATMPLFNPTGYMHGGHTAITEVKKRIRKLKAFFED